MIEKLKEMFKPKDKKVENLIFLLIVLIITLICINSIISDEEEPEDKKYKDAELASSSTSQTSLEARIESILSKIDGVRESFSFSYICK